MTSSWTELRFWQHLLLTASNYHAQLGLLMVLRNIGTLFVYMIATLPLSAKMELKELLHFTQLEVFCAESNWPNLQCRIQLLPNRPRDRSRVDTLVADAGTICRQVVRYWLTTAGSRPINARRIYCVRTKAMSSPIQMQLGCHFYLADLDHLWRDQMITKWSEEIDFLIFVAKATLSASLDHRSIRLILHIDASGRLVYHVQETGRDSKPASDLS